MGDVFAHWRVNEWKIATIFLFQNARYAYKWLWRITIFSFTSLIWDSMWKVCDFYRPFRFPLPSPATLRPPLSLPSCEFFRSHTHTHNLFAFCVGNSRRRLLAYLNILCKFTVNIPSVCVCVWWRRRQHHFLQTCVSPTDYSSVSPLPNVNHTIKWVQKAIPNHVRRRYRKK